jgi:RNA polymerase sigma-32 factor
MSRKEAARRPGETAGREHDHASSLLINPANSQLALQKQGDSNFLSVDEEQRLVRAWRDRRDHNSRNKLVTAHLPLVRALIAKRLSELGGEVSRAGKPGESGKPKKTTAIDNRDLENESIEGLIKAADRFDPERGIRFSTYAVFWARYFIDRWLKQNLFEVRKHEVASLDAALGADDPATLVETIADGDHAERIGSPLPDAATIRETGRFFSRVREVALSSLSERERRIFAARHLTDNPVLLRDLAAEHGISAERCRQIDRAAYAKATAAIAADNVIRRDILNVFAGARHYWRVPGIPWAWINRWREDQAIAAAAA